MFESIDHIGVVVSDLDAAVSLYRDQFGLIEAHRAMAPEMGVEAVLFEVGSGHIELLRPLGGDSGVARFLESRGPGLHHVAYRTDDLDSSLEAVRAAGLSLIDEHPRYGIKNSRVAFIHPEATGGVLTELVEPAQ